MVNKYSLYMTGLPIIETLTDLEEHTRLSKGLLYKLWKVSHLFYHERRLRKKSGGIRIIAAPAKTMKAVQYWILKNILEQVKVSPHATAFIKGVNILKNITPHMTQYFENQYFMCLDIKDFFPTIKYKHVYSVFNALGYSPHISHILSSICTYKGCLPQGGVTSPALSNIVCIRLDKRVAGCAGKRNITYTRYADDFTFSSANQNKFKKVREIVTEILINEGYELNENKTRILGPRRCRKITGITIRDKGFGIGRKQKRIIRSAIHKVFKTKIDEIKKETLKNYVQGWLAFMKDIDAKGHEQLTTYLNKCRNTNNFTG